LFMLTVVVCSFARDLVFFVVSVLFVFFLVWGGGGGGVVDTDKCYQSDRIALDLRMRLVNLTYISSVTRHLFTYSL
jgi:hypothetical protein